MVNSNGKIHNRFVKAAHCHLPSLHGINTLLPEWEPSASDYHHPGKNLIPRSIRCQEQRLSAARAFIHPNIREIGRKREKYY
jgi:hypothetical protein